MDFGCGNGNLSFYLALKYHPTIIGIDYSKDAIVICNERKTVLLNKKVNLSKISFVNRNNQSLPELNNISAIYACDVFEHMYDTEINKVLKIFKRWKGKKNIKLIVHTDNDLYLNFVRPLLDLLALITGKTTIKFLTGRNIEEKKVHVNLTNPSKLNRLMSRHGFHQNILTYPKVTTKKISQQLGPLSRFRLLVQTAFIILSVLKFLSPSFYAVYEY